jgi:hypothetical protein
MSIVPIEINFHVMVRSLDKLGTNLLTIDVILGLMSLPNDEG